MNESAVRQLAQSDPVPNLTQNLGRHTVDARKLIENLRKSLRDIDLCREQLADQGVTVDVDLGPIGNAAAAARRDLERDTGRTFEMPRSVTGRCPSCNARPGDRHGANCATLTGSDRG